MGTRWRGMLAPVNTPTGDGRRIKQFTHRDLPLPFKWQREDDRGHDNSVVVGVTEQIQYLTTREAIDGGWISEETAGRAGLADDTVGVWAVGEFLDDADPATMPRLAEDVAEAMLLVSKGVLGPSVDAGAVEFFGWVHPGTDDLITEEEWEEAYESGQQQVEEEALFSSYEIAAATLVTIPAFSETSRPFELLTSGDPDEGSDSDSDGEGETAARAALVAAAAAPAAPPAAWFDNPQLDRLTALTVTDDGQVFGHVAAWGTCHLEFKGVCVTPPDSEANFAPFNRFTETPQGLRLPVASGRITTGHGKVGTGCRCCHGKDDHACVQASLSQVLTHHDQLRTLAWVRAGRDDHGIWVAGMLAPNLADRDREVLSRQKVSGDWRQIGDGLELVEVLALARQEPGFPLPTMGMRGGRQTALVAAGPVAPPSPAAPGLRIDYPRLGREVAAALRAGGLTIPAPTAAELAVTAAEGHTGAMIALVPSVEDAARLAVDDGEPAEELHLTLAYLGTASDISEEVRAQILEAAESVVAARKADGGAVDGDVFAVDVFNPGDDQETAIVLGVGGDQLQPTRDAVLDTIGQVKGLELPTQHEPFVPHITLVYSQDLTLVEQLTDRMGPVSFDRLRVAFADEVVDIPLAGGDSSNSDNGQAAVASAAGLLAELDQATAQVRAHHVAQLAAELQEVV